MEFGEEAPRVAAGWRTLQPPPTLTEKRQEEAYISSSEEEEEDQPAEVENATRKEEAATNLAVLGSIESPSTPRFK